MNCPKCEGEVAPSILIIQVGSRLIELHCYKCGQGHSFSTAQQLASAKEQFTPSLKLRRKISVSGNALSIRIPKDLADELKIKEGDEVALSLHGKDSFIVERERV